MKSLLVVLTLLLLGEGTLSGITRIHDRNVAVQKAQVAYSRRDFAEAARYYQAAVDEFGAKEDAVVLNLAHACWRAGQSAQARTYYGQLLTSPTPAVRSVAQQQLALLATQRNEYAQAVGLLRQALLSNSHNAGARYNYELLRDYLARRQQSPTIPPPATPPTGGKKPEPKPTDPQNQANQPKPTDGTNKPGQLDDPTQPQDPRNAPQQRPDQNGQRDANRPGNAPGNEAPGGFQPGEGAQRNVARSSQPGTVRGLSDAAEGPEAASGRSRRAGTDLAAPDEAQLQTQRARLEQMNLNPDRARQLLNSLGDAEQQYLQQLPHKAEKKTDSGKPAW